MKAVLDTNVLVSGLLSHAGPPARLLDAIETGLLIPVFSEPILLDADNPGRHLKPPLTGIVMNTAIFRIRPSAPFTGKAS